MNLMDWSFSKVSLLEEKKKRKRKENSITFILIGEGYKEKTFLPLETECTDFFLIYSDPFPDSKFSIFF